MWNSYGFHTDGYCCESCVEVSKMWSNWWHCVSTFRAFWYLSSDKGIAFNIVSTGEDLKEFPEWQGWDFLRSDMDGIAKPQFTGSGSENPWGGWNFWFLLDFALCRSANLYLCENYSNQTEHKCYIEILIVKNAFVCVFYLPILSYFSWLFFLAGNHVRVTSLLRDASPHQNSWIFGKLPNSLWLYLIIVTGTTGGARVKIFCQV